MSEHTIHIGVYNYYIYLHELCHISICIYVTHRLKSTPDHAQAAFSLQEESTASDNTWLDKYNYNSALPRQMVGMHLTINDSAAFAHSGLLAIIDTLYRFTSLYLS